MFLGEPVFQISFQLEKVAELVEALLKKKNWHEFEKGEIKLVLKPFYLFYYDAGFEKEGKPSKETKRGRLVLDGETAELGRELSERMPDESQLVKELPDSYPVVVRKPLFSRQEAEKIALLKTSSLLGTERSNIVLTGFRMFYFPQWAAFVTVAGETRLLEISAVTGELLNEEKVPLREKGFVEITKETLEELKEPGAWLRYSQEMVQMAGKSLARKEHGQKIPAVFHKASFWVSIALIAVLILLFVFFR